MDITNKILTGLPYTQEELIESSWDPEIKEYIKVRGLRKFKKLYKKIYNIPEQCSRLSPKVKYIMNDDRTIPMEDYKSYDVEFYDNLKYMYNFYANTDEVIKSLDDPNRPEWVFRQERVIWLLQNYAYCDEHIEYMLKRCPELELLFVEEN